MGFRNFILWLLGAFRPLIFLMEPENTHYSMKKTGVFWGSTVMTRWITGLFFNYGHKNLNTEEINTIVDACMDHNSDKSPKPDSGAAA